jgi:hypothetical protein
MDYVAAVLSLLDAGSIRLFFETNDRKEVAPDRPTVEGILTRRLQLPAVTQHPPLRKAVPHRPPREIRPAEPDLRIELTPTGGEIWEKRAGADWNRYVQTLTDVRSGEACSANRNLLMAFLGWYEELNSAIVDRSTIKLEVLHDHHVTYWKVLPAVNCATFACKWTDVQRVIDGPKWFQEWWRELDEWYKKPWELPGWPRETEEKVWGRD